MNAWQQFFDQYADRYDEEIFTKNTAAEIPFILEHLAPPAGGTILDIGCGTGRHSVPLAQHGFKMTGVDISTGMLAIAQQRAAAANVSVEWVHADATTFVRQDSFDRALCLCEGAFCLLSGDDDPLEHDMTILRNIRQSLRPGGKLILNVLSASRILRNNNDDAVRSGQFDPLTLCVRSDATKLVPNLPEASQIRERHYTAPELQRMFRAADFNIRGIYGGTAGNWGLRPIEMDEYEIMVFAERPA